MNLLSRGTTVLLICVLAVLSYMAIIPIKLSAILAIVILSVFAYSRYLGGRTSSLLKNNGLFLKRYNGIVAVKSKTKLYKSSVFAALTFFFLASILPFSDFFYENVEYGRFITLYSATITIIALIYMFSERSRSGVIKLCVFNLLFVVFNLITTVATSVSSNGQISVSLLLWAVSALALFLLLFLFSDQSTETRIDRDKETPVGRVLGSVKTLLYPSVAVMIIYYLMYIDGLYMLINIALFIYIVVKAFKSMEVATAFNRAQSKVLPSISFILAALLLVSIVLYEGSAKVITLLFAITTLSVVASGLNLVVGFTGLLDLGYIAFFGMGAYVAAIFSNTHVNTMHFAVPILVALLLSTLFSGTFGTMVGAPTLLIKGDFLAIITLGFGEVFRIVVNNLDHFNGHNITNGPNGIYDIPAISIFGHSLDKSLNIPLLGKVDGNRILLLLLMLFLGITLIIVRNLKRSLYGKALLAIKQDEVIASSMGVNTFLAKIGVFMLGASFAGLFGGLYAHITKTVTPDQFQFVDSINLLVAVILGGGGMILGPVIGEIIVITLPEKLRFLDDYRLLIFAALLIVAIKMVPNGILGSLSNRK